MVKGSNKKTSLSKLKEKKKKRIKNENNEHQFFETVR